MGTHILREPRKYGTIHRETQDEETACDKLIDALMLPENEASEDGYDAHFPLNPTRRLFHHFAPREKATHANVSTPCSHHTYGSSMFLRNKSSFTNTSNDAKKVADKSDGNVMRNTSNHDKPGMEESEEGAVHDVEDMITEEHDEEQEDKETNEEELLEEDEDYSCTHFSERPFATGTVSCTLFSAKDSKNKKTGDILE
jgi:hypothetical protein